MIEGLRRFFSRTSNDASQPVRHSAVEARVPECFAQIVRSITTGIITLDGTGHITSLNAAASAIFNIGQKPVLGRAMIEIVPSIHLDRRVREALEGNASRGTIEILGHGGGRNLTVATVPIEGEPGAIVIVNDETRLHELEQTRRDFVSNVAHELRTPLSSIKLMIETIADRPDDEEARALFLPRVRDEVDRLVDLVEDLLDVARGESGQMVLRCEPVDVTSLGASVLTTFKARAEALRIALSFSGDEAFVSGDADRLTQVFVNLIDNALRHTVAEGSVHVRVESGERSVRLIVADTGIGIPYNDLPHIFERFYVVDRSRAREFGGTGLGLSIVKQIVEAHGGTITVESELGRGTTFACSFSRLLS